MAELWQYIFRSLIVDWSFWKRGFLLWLLRYRTSRATFHGVRILSAISFYDCNEEKNLIESNHSELSCVRSFVKTAHGAFFAWSRWMLSCNHDESVIFLRILVFVTLMVNVNKNGWWRQQIQGRKRIVESSAVLLEDPEAHPNEIPHHLRMEMPFPNHQSRNVGFWHWWTQAHENDLEDLAFWRGVLCSLHPRRFSGTE